MSLNQALTLDVVVYLICATLLFTRGKLSLSHPAVMYLAFHLIVFTTRAVALTGNVPRLFSLTNAEAARALNVADLLLVVLTLSWTIPAPERWSAPVTAPAMVRPSIVRSIALFALPIGLYSDLTQSYGADSGLVNHDISTSYQIFAVTWPGQVLLAFIYLYGFRTYFTAPIFGFLAFMGLQGQSRFRLLLPTILLAQIYVDRKRIRLFSIRVLAALAVVGILFFQLDNIGRAFRSGTLSLNTITNTFTGSESAISSGTTTDQEVFDQYAITLALSDQYGRPQLGRHFLDLLALPIPRPMWPNKPTTDEHLRAISTNDRPLATIGAVFTLPGELYTDWRYPGLVLIGFSFGRVLLFWYKRSRAYGYGSAAHLAYIVFAALLIQIYRDGLASAPVFFLVHSAPLVAMAALSALPKPRGAMPKTEAADVN